MAGVAALGFMKRKARLLGASKLLIVFCLLGDVAEVYRCSPRRLRARANVRAIIQKLLALRCAPVPATLRTRWQ
jgi:hypothetical protein